MKPVPADLAERYEAALCSHVRARKPGTGARARALGRTALAGGLVTLDLAIIHERAVVALASKLKFTDTANGALARAGVFFTQALVPLEEARRVTAETNLHLREREATLRQHTAELALSNRKLAREVERRKAGETALREGRAHYQKLFREAQVMQQRLRQLTRQIIVVQEEERKRISRELHDEIVQALVGIHVELAALTREHAVGAKNLKAKIARAQRMVENSVKAVHQFARKLRPAVLDDLGLIPALHSYCRGLAARKGLRIRMKAFAGVELLDGNHRTVLFRVAQEALNNVMRHARATRVRVSIIRVDEVILLEIEDNGRGFPVARALKSPGNKRLGLVGMRERVEMVGGTLTMKSAAGEGTTVCAEIPFKPSL